MYTTISAALSAAQITGANTGITSVKTNLPFLVNLSPAERGKLSKMGPDGFSYVTKAIDYATNNASIIPAAMNLAEAQKDLKLYNDLRPIFQQVAQLLEAIDDTMMAAGVEAKDFADLFYSMAKSFAATNVPGMDTIAADLGVFYEKAQAEAQTPDNNIA